MRQGASFCPGILHAVPARDGLLIRVRTPGGLLTAAQLHTLAALASEHSNGELEITARANLQLRALTSAAIPTIAAALEAAGLLPSPTHDRIRNLVQSPFAGLDPQEILDTTPYLIALDQALCDDPIFTQLHPKFTFAFDGGGPRYSPETDDLTLEATSLTTFRLLVAGHLIQDEIPTTQAIPTLLTLTRTCIALAAEHNVPVRTKHLLQYLTLVPLPSSLLPALTPTPPSNETTLVPTIPLGRLTSNQAYLIADLTSKHHLTLRLTPWRGLILAYIPQADHKQITTDLTQAFPNAENYRGLSACAGTQGCDAALADVRTDAHTLAALALNRTINLSACGKQCARRHSADADLIAAEQGYTVSLAGTQLPGFFTAAQAIATIERAFSC